MMKKKMCKISFMAAATSAVLLLGSGFTLAADPKKATGSLEATFVLPKGGEVKSGALYLKERRVELAAGKSSVLVSEVPSTTYTLACDAMVKLASGETKRFAVVQQVSVKVGETTKVALTLAEAGSMEKFCSACHPAQGEPVKPGQITRDVHASGKVMKSKNLASTVKYNAEVERLTKDGKKHNLPIILEKRKVVEEGKTVEREFITCESCHTFHWSTGERSFARAPFVDSPDLCVGCH